MNRLSKEDRSNRVKVLESMALDCRSVEDMARTLDVSKPRVYQMLRQYRLDRRVGKRRPITRTPIESKMLRLLKQRMKGYRPEQIQSVADSVDIPKECPIFGYPIDYLDSMDIDMDTFGPSFMLIDARRRYVPGNVIIVCRAANRLRGSWNIQEFEIMLKFLKEHDPKVKEKELFEENLT